MFGRIIRHVVNTRPINISNKIMIAQCIRDKPQQIQLNILCVIDYRAGEFEVWNPFMCNLYCVHKYIHHTLLTCENGVQPLWCWQLVISPGNTMKRGNIKMYCFPWIPLGILAVYCSKLWIEAVITSVNYVNGGCSQTQAHTHTHRTRAQEWGEFLWCLSCDSSTLING